MRTALAAALLLSIPALAGAQDASRGYVEGIAGVAHTVETDSVYAGLGAWRLTHRLLIFGEVGRMQNAIGPELSDRLDAVRAEINATNIGRFGSEFPIVFEARVPTWYGMGGLRVDGPSRGRLSTYVEGGAGTARLDPQVHLTINDENLDAEAAALTGLGDGRQQLEFLAGGGAGVAFRAWRRVRIEGGYRYMRIFGDARTNVNRAHAGAAWTF